MRIVCLEEHVLLPAVRDAWAASATAGEDGLVQVSSGRVGDLLLDVGEGRLEAMRAMGVDTQVLSLTNPGVQNLLADEAVPLARAANDAIATAVASHPEHFEGFATLPTSAPAAAAQELRRAHGELGLKGAMIFGRTRSTPADDVSQEPIYATAAELRVPLYLHPQVPVVPVREAYYTGFSPVFDAMFARFGLGWHIDAGIALLRLIFAGTFDRHPDLQIITGHWGEAVLFFEERVAALDWFGLGLERPIGDYLRQNVFYTPSGMTSERYMRWAIEVVGVERLLYAVDYPFVVHEDGGARRFLEQAPLSGSDRHAIAHGNWERLIDRGR